MDADTLITELQRERDAFFEALSAVAPESMTTIGCHPAIARRSGAG